MNKQARDLANTIAAQAQALADGRIPEGQVYAQLARLADNVTTLRTWVGDDRQAPPSTWRDLRDRQQQ
jgi:hypothetical protein